ncbi:MAG: carbamoyltransferase [Candidatus Omnitrophota bacterium]
MNILGVSCFYHDSAACLLREGEVVSAAQEERFNRSKNSPVFPVNAINFCLQEADITIGDVDCIGFYEKPFLKFGRVILNHLKSYPFSFRNFLETTPGWLEDRLAMPLVFKKELGYDGKVYFIKHHLSHAASAFLVSNFQEAAILTADGVGEWATLTCGTGRENKIEIFKELCYPNSLGLLYTAVTTYLGFEPLEGEGKVMGLAGYGKSRFLDKFREIVQVKPDGSFKIDCRFFGFNKGMRMYSGRFIKAFGKDRNPADKIQERHCDIAASLQKFVEDTVILISRDLYNRVKVDKICLAGGLFLNCVLNHKIIEETPFKEIFIQPASGDSGGALGAASYIYNSLLERPRNYVMDEAFLGPGFSAQQIKRAVINNNLGFKEMDDLDLYRYAAKEISRNKIVGWFQGRMEFGPRALGNRSILANPCCPQIGEILNSKVKKREPFRPYAPAVLEERAEEFFQLRHTSPFMLLAPLVREGKRSLIPGVTHVDGTARVETVNRQINPRLWDLIHEFELITGIPMVINTSFNFRGEPIVCSPQDAIDCFKQSQMDCLVLGNCVVER